MEEEDEEAVIMVLDQDDDNEAIDDNEASFVNLDVSNEEWFSNLPAEELLHHKEHVLDALELERESVVCTSCFRQINHKQAGAVLRHPVLGVAVCKQCRAFYYAGDWTRDEDGYDEFCRWCANGGDLLCCDTCTRAFCRKCIKRNLGRVKVSEIEESEQWRCLVCDPRQVWRQRGVFYSVWMFQKTIGDQEDGARAKGKKKMKKSFIDDALKDGTGVNKIFGDYLEKAKSSWKKKAEEGKEEDVRKMVKKIRTIISISQHNLRLLDQNIVDGLQAQFPHIGEDTVTPEAIPEPEPSTQPGKKQEAEVDQTESHPMTNGNDNDNHSHDESRDMFGDSSNDEHHSSRVSTNNTDANKRAREDVLRSTSSESDVVVKSRQEEVSPRKKLKTKKELDDLRRKSHVDNEDDVSGHGSEDESDFSVSSVEQISPKRKSISSSGKQSKGEKKESWTRLNMIASKVDISTNAKLKLKTKVDIGNLEESFLTELQEGRVSQNCLPPLLWKFTQLCFQIDINDHPSLAALCSAQAEDDRDIDRCDRPEGVAGAGLPTITTRTPPFHSYPAVRLDLCLLLIAGMLGRGRGTVTATYTYCIYLQVM